MRGVRPHLEYAGLDIPPSKLGLRPSFPLVAVSDPGRRVAIEVALEWFALVVLTRLAPADRDWTATPF